MATKQNKVAKKPSFDVFQVIELGKNKSYWNRIGAAWTHEDGEGISVTLNAMPLDGRIILRTVKDKQS